MIKALGNVNNISLGNIMDKIFAKRLFLRRMNEIDLDLFVSWSNSDIASGKFLSPEKYTKSVCQSKFENNYFWNDESKTYIIELKEEISIGVIHYWIKPEDDRVAMIALKIAYPEHRGKGYGTESQIILIKHLFDIKSFSLIEMLTDIDNIPEQRCLSILGFDHVKTQIYDDCYVERVGYVYQLNIDKYKSLPIYRYYFEE